MTKHDDIDTPGGLLHRQLCIALTMEQDSLDALGELQQAAQSAAVKKLFSHHAEETEEQISNLHAVLDILTLTAKAAPSQATKGISTQVTSLLEKSSRSLHDRIALSGALGNEHYEIAAYQTLLTPLAALGVSDATALLTANLDQERHASDEIRQLLENVVEHDH